MKATVENNPIENLLDAMQEHHKISEEDGPYILVSDITEELESLEMLSKILPEMYRRSKEFGNLQKKLRDTQREFDEYYSASSEWRNN